jgi:hypothetical protein
MAPASVERHSPFPLGAPVQHVVVVRVDDETLNGSYNRPVDR